MQVQGDGRQRSQQSQSLMAHRAAHNKVEGSTTLHDSFVFPTCCTFLLVDQTEIVVDISFIGHFLSRFERSEFLLS